ncbi:DUF2993 domain-containing protein [Pannus brasiliensis CCIBt3594]|uniref:DUF2993 domain-containing protein n=1 Tax=Pannus brasiliensis CCIBt3594 TaxID=1427578 RepID=A0AAW9QX31_9CHRO
MSQDRDLSAVALSKIAEVGIAGQLDEVEDLNVEVNTDPLHILQGQVESLSIEGTGLVMKEELRVEKMELQTGAIAVNPFKIPFGQLELTDSTSATTRVVLTEEDINRAFRSDYIQKKLLDLPEISLEGKPIRLEHRQIEFRFLDGNKIFLAAEILWTETGEKRAIALTAIPRIGEDRQKIRLDDVEHGEETELSPEITAELLQQARHLLDLSNFELMEGMQLFLDEIRIDRGTMTLVCDARVQPISL